MAQSLSTLIRDRNRSTGSTLTPENNLETGQIFMFVPGTLYSQYSNQFGGGFCWQAPGTGTAVIEIWGAGGSAGKAACCGFGLPGNSGGYARKTISVAAGTYVCGIPGFSCGAANSNCFRGCSDPSVLCWYVSGGCNGCMCAQGGRGGISYCSTGTGPFCCYYFGGGFCGTGRDLVCGNANQFCSGGVTGLCGPNQQTSICGIICNVCSGTWTSSAYGGDVNCPGIPGCVSYDSYCPCQYCYFKYHVPTPAGLFTTDGGTVTFSGNETDDQSAGVTKTFHSLMSAMGGMSKAPRRGMPHVHCYNNGRGCGCYEFQGCIPVLPIGMGAPPPQVCNDLCDVGIRGGMGAIRIKFF